MARQPQQHSAHGTTVGSVPEPQYQWKCCAGALWGCLGSRVGALRFMEIGGSHMGALGGRRQRDEDGSAGGVEADGMGLMGTGGAISRLWGQRLLLQLNQKRLLRAPHCGAWRGAWRSCRGGTPAHPGPQAAVRGTGQSWGGCAHMEVRHGKDPCTWHGMAGYSTAWHGTAWCHHGRTWHSTAWHVEA